MSDTNPPPPTTYEGGDPPTTYEGGGPAATVVEGARQGRRRRLVLPDPVLAEYEYDADLSSGSQADVVLCTRRADGLRVAIKIYRGELGHVDRDALARLDGADPDHVVPLLDLQTWEGETWEVQEYFPLGSLADAMAQSGGPLSETMTRALTQELSAAIAHVHDRDIVHRDLKPANILIRTLDPLDCVLADFGLATQLLVSRAARSVAGTMAYTAPEASYGSLHKAADWWSLGVILFEALTGAHIFADPQTGRMLSDHQIRVNLNQGDYDLSGLPDERWQLLIGGLLTRNPDHRWDSLEVEEWLAGGSPVVVQDEAAPQRRGIAPLQFGDTSCATPQQLAAAIREDFDRAEAMLADVLTAERLRGWLRDHGFGPDVDSRFGKIDNRKVLTMRLVGLQLLMDPGSPPVFRNRPLTLESIEEVCERAEGGDRDASRWITDLREHQVLAAWASELESGQEIAAAGERLRAWWNRLGTRAAGAVGANTKELLPTLEGPLLRAAFSQQVRDRFAEQSSSALRGEDDLLPAWARTLAQEARDDDPSNLGVKVLATGVVPAQREIAQRARDAAAEAAREEAARQRQIADERAAEARRAQARARTRRRRGADLVAVGLTAALCVTVGVPWLLGRFVLRDTFFRGTDGSVFDAEVRHAKDYFLTDWLAGCSFIVLVAVAFLVLRPWRGRAVSVVVGGAALAGVCLWLLPYSAHEWDLKEAASVQTLRTTDYPFEDRYFTCGKASTLIDGEPWTVVSARIKGSPVDGCNRVVLWHGWQRIQSFDLKPGQLVDSISVSAGPRALTTAKARAKHTVFVVDFEDSGSRKIRLADFYDPAW